MSSCAKIMIPFTPMEPMKPMMKFLDCRRPRSRANKRSKLRRISASYLCTSCISVHPRIRFLSSILYQQHEWVWYTVVTFIISNLSPPKKKHCEMSSSFSSKLCLQLLVCWLLDFIQRQKKLRSKHQHKTKAKHLALCSEALQALVLECPAIKEFWCTATRGTGISLATVVR